VSSCFSRPSDFERNDLFTISDLGENYERLGTVLGEGAFGSVELGRKKEDMSFVAIKTMYALQNRDERTALERELSCLSSIRNHGGHPNLLSLYDVAGGGSSPLEIVTELCSGGELFDVIVEDGKMNQLSATKIVHGE